MLRATADGKMAGRRLNGLLDIRDEDVFQSKRGLTGLLMSASSSVALAHEIKVHKGITANAAAPPSPVRLPIGTF